MPRIWLSKCLFSGQLISARDFAINFGDNWSGVTTNSEAYVELDWARQAMCAGLDRSSEKLLASVDAIIGRAERMTADSAFATSYQ